MIWSPALTVVSTLLFLVEGISRTFASPAFVEAIIPGTRLPCVLGYG